MLKIRYLLSEIYIILTFRATFRINNSLKKLYRIFMFLSAPHIIRKNCPSNNAGFNTIYTKLTKPYPKQDTAFLYINPKNRMSKRTFQKMKLSTTVLERELEDASSLAQERILRNKKDSPRGAAENSNHGVAIPVLQIGIWNAISSAVWPKPPSESSD